MSLRKTSLTIDMASASASMLFMGDNKAVATLYQVYSFCTSPHSPLPVAPRTTKRIRPRRDHVTLRVKKNSTFRSAERSERQKEYALSRKEGGYGSDYDISHFSCMSVSV